MFFRFPRQIVYFLFLLVPFWLIFFNSSSWHGLKMKAMGLMTASVATVRWPLNEAVRLLSYRRIWQENQRLQRESGSLKSRIVQLEEIVRETNRFGRLYQFRDSKSFDSVMAAVIARDPANWNSSIMINRGKRDGLRPGMAVINVDGVVGKVAEVSDRAAKVVLIGDPGFSVAAINRRSRESALVSGTLSGSCRMLYLPENPDLELEDEVITSALSSDFPPGLLIGHVVRIKEFAAGTRRQVDIHPAVDVSTLEEVLVLK